MRKLTRREQGNRGAIKKMHKNISEKKNVLSLEMFLKENYKIASQQFLYRTKTSFRHLFNMPKQKSESEHLLFTHDRNSF